MNKDKIRSILLNYEKKRDYHQSMLEKRINDVNTKIPEIEEINNEISQIGLKLTKAVLLDPDARNEIVLKAKNELDKLKTKKNNLLKINGISNNYSELTYDCNNCKDTGFLPSGEKCTCFKQQIINEAYKMSNLNKILIKENFANFDFNIFSSEKLEEYNTSPRENILNIFSICENFVLNFDKKNNENLLFYGSTGLGKTYLCNCIAKDLLDSGHIVIYQTSFRILETIKDYRFRKDSSDTLNDENYKNLFSCDLLIIDDLGTELKSSFNNTEIFNLINTRLVSGKKIIISTNLTPSQLANTYTQRTFSRILDKFRVLKFIGHDLRWERFK